MNGPGFTIDVIPVWIEDYPRFPWRGLMMDVARHFFPISQLERIIDAMAYNKLNSLHLHLTDGEVFSIILRSFPKLAEYGSWDITHAAYTLEDMAHIVQYAKNRGIRIIPEIDVPAHTRSWALAYPDISAHCPKYNPHPEWPGYYTPMDPSNELIYSIIDGVIKDLTSVFPDKYFHMGGDETHFICWDQDNNITQFKQKKNFKSNYELYGYFFGRIEKIVNKYGKIM